MKTLTRISTTSVEFVVVNATVDTDLVIYNGSGEYKFDVWMDEEGLFDKDAIIEKLEECIYDDITWDINNAERDVDYDIMVFDFTWKRD